MSDVVWTALIVAFFGLLTTLVPVLLARQATKARAAEKASDYAREDAVAARVAELSRIQAMATRVTNDKLDDIHVLVNSTLTAAIQSAYDATASSLVLMREVVRLNSAAGEVPSGDATAAIEATEAKLASLRAVLTDRQRATKAVETQQHERAG